MRNLSLIALTLGVAILSLACDAPATVGSPSPTATQPRRTYDVTTVTCGSYFITNLPSGTEIAPGPGSWLTYYDRVGSSASVTQCTSETYTYGEIQGCRYDPGAYGCETVAPNYDYGTVDAGGGSGGYGGSSPSSSDIELRVSPCNYRYRKDPQTGRIYYVLNEVLACQRQFFAEERSVVQQALDSLMRPTSDPGFTNDSARTECGQMRGWLADALADTDLNKFGVGRSNSSDHEGAASIGGQLAHLDPRMFDDLYVSSGLYHPLSTHRDYYRRILSLALHEMAHAYGSKIHLVGGVEEVGPIYTTPYFKWTSGWGAENTCVK